MAKKSKSKATVSSASESQLLKPKSQNKDKKTKAVALPQPSIDEDSEVDQEAEKEEGDFGDDSGDEEEDDDDESDSDYDGVDQEGMERLVKLLGEDGLDDFDRAQLRGMADEEGEGEDEEENGDEEEQKSSADEQEEEDISDEDEENDISLVKPTTNSLPSSDEEQEDEEEDHDEIPLDEVESFIDEDTVPKQKLEIDNQVALERIRQNIQLDPSLPWTETLVLTYPQKIEVDVNDDLNRELAFYKQALHSAQTAHTLSIKHKLPFTRPSDYFAEMVKSDSHMERIRQRLLNESASIKQSEEKRKEREGKKFGKQVQMEKLKERERDKKDMEDRLKNLKRKRKDMLDSSKGDEGEDFDVAVEDAISDRPSKRNKSSSSSQKSRMPRNARDKKFGFGGAGRRSKQNTKESTDNFAFGGGRGKKGPGGGVGKKGGKGGKKQRPGKARRMTARSK